MHPLKKAFFVALGCISLVLGTIGIALPTAPSGCTPGSPTRPFIKSTSPAISVAAA